MKFDVSPAWAKIQAMGYGLASMLPNLVLAMVVFTISCLIARWAKTIIVGFYHRRGRHENLGLLLGRVVQSGLVLINLLIALSIILPTFSARDIIQVLGISGVAIGFAFRDILQNFLAGLLILLAEPFRVGEEIRVGSLTGVVQDIQARATLLKTSDGFLVVIPNATIYTEKITVLNAYDAQRTSVEFVVGLRDDLDEARRLAVEAARSVEGVLEKPSPSAVYVGFAPNGVRLRARWWTDAKRGDDVSVRDRAIPAITSRLLDAGVEIAYPTQQVLFHDQTEEWDGDRARQRAGWPAGRGDVPRQLRLGDAVARLAEAAARAGADGGGNGGPSRRAGGDAAPRGDGGGESHGANGGRAAQGPEGDATSRRAEGGAR
jgi:small-conductance mechanosensitive channel